MFGVNHIYITIYSETIFLERYHAKIGQLPVFKVRNTHFTDLTSHFDIIMGE